MSKVGTTNTKPRDSERVIKQTDRLKTKTKKSTFKSSLRESITDETGKTDTGPKLPTMRIADLLTCPAPWLQFYLSC